MESFSPAIFAALCAASLCVLAVFFDLRERRIPNQLNYFFLFAAFSLSLAFNKLGFSFVIFATAAFVFSYLLYYLGAWAGGDAKFFTALLAYYPLLKSASLGVIPLVFIASAVVLVPTLFAIHFNEIVSFKREFFSAISSSLRPSLRGAVFSTLLLSAFYFATGQFALLALEKIFPQLAAAFAALLALSFLKKSFSFISQKILRKPVPLSSLREGDIPAKSVCLVKGRVVLWQPPSFSQLLASAGRLDFVRLKNIFYPPGTEVCSCLRARGLSAPEIVGLKKAGVKTLVVKKSIAFAPALALGFALVAWLA